MSINILSFITLVKKKEHSSIVYRKGENMLKRSRVLGISYNNYKKYLKYCIDNGLTHTNSRGDIIISSMKKVIIFMNDGVVNEKNLPINRFIKFFNYTKYDNITFKKVRTKIREEMVLRNYKQQEYNLSKRKNLSHALDNGKKTGLGVRLAKKQGVSFDTFKKSLSKGCDTIVSGKNHVAGIVNMSPSSGTRILQKLSKDKIINRTINRVLIANRHNPYMVKAYMDIYGGLPIIPFSNGLLYRFIGSSINLNSIHSYTNPVSRVQNEKNN